MDATQATRTRGAALTVGGAIADLLRDAGARHFFLLTGGDNAFFMELEARGIVPILARSERSAAFMADAYARLTRKPAFVYGQFGPGAAVVLSGIIDSTYGHSPVVAICSETKTDVVGRFAYQELDQVSMFRPVTKYATRLEAAGRVGDVMSTAIGMAVSGCPGPSYVGVPSDLLLSAVPAESPLHLTSGVRTTPIRPRGAAEEMTRAVGLLAGARQPVVLAGAGCNISGAYGELDRLALKTGIPVLTTVGGKGSVSERAAYACGVAGRYARLSANEILRQADLVIAIGTRLSDMTTDRGRAFPPARGLIHVDIDSSVFGRNLPAEVAITADAATFIADLAEMVPALDISEWSRAVTAITRKWQSERSELAQKVDGKLTPLNVIHGLRSVMADRDILVSDTGYMAAWSAALFDVNEAGPYYLRTAGSLGWAVPASLGAQLAAPDSRVVALTGDGGLGYHISELETAVRLNIPVVVVVLNNGMLAFERHVQLSELGRWSENLTNFSDCDYAGVARAFGAWAARVDTMAELHDALAAALMSGRASLLDVRVAHDPLPPVTNFDGQRSL